jgi:LAS superfamily LD-carboxypeptidase LdcB
MAVGLLLVVVNPALGDAAAAHSASAVAWQAAFARQVGPSQAVQDGRAATRAGIADVATEAVAQVADVRTRAVQAALPAEQLAALDSLSQQVNQLVAQVESLPRVSRAGERAAGTPSASGTGAGSTPSASGATGTTGATPSATGTPGTASTTGTPGTASTTGTPGTASTTGTPGTTGTAAGTSSSTGAAGAAPSAAATTSAGAGTATSAASAPADAATPVPTDAATPTPTDSAAADASGPTTPQIVVTDAASVEAALPTVTGADDPTAAALRAAVLALTQEVAHVSSAADDALAQAAAARAVADQAATAQAADQAAAQKAAWKVSLEGYANGRIPASALCAPDFAPSALLRCDATQAIDRLNAAFARAFGHNLTLDDSYRSYAAQVQCTRIRGWLCAVPGTSNHGLGIAVDIGDAGAYGTAAYRWLTVNGPTYGWHNPAWALASGYKHEPWHWEYAG